MTDLETIKQKIDIVSLISEYVTLAKTGANFKGLCPFHQEKSPSFIVSPERQIWHCFGGCQDGGDIFRFIMRAENLEFVEALEFLAKRAGIKLETNPNRSKIVDQKQKIYQINSLASNFFNYILTSHPLGTIAREYLQARKINDSSIKLFGLGYAPNSWDSLVKFMQHKNYSVNDLIESGLVSKSSDNRIFDRFRGRLIFTLKDQHGNCLGFAGRTLDPQAKEAKYINTSETPVYVKGNVLYGLEITKDEIKKKSFAVVVEGEIDMIQSYQAGVRNVVAIKGSAFTENQINLLKRYCQKIVLSLDADFAGDAAAHRGILLADSAGMDINIAVFFQAKDPDELIKLDPNLWRSAVEQAVPFYDFIITSAMTKYSANTATGAKNIVKDVAVFLGTIDNLIVKNHYLKKLSSLLNISIDIVAEQINKEVKKMSLGDKKNQETDDKANSQQVNRQTKLSSYLLSLLLQSERPQDYLILIQNRLTTNDLEQNYYQEIFKHLNQFTSVVPIFSLQNFVETLPKELCSQVDILYLNQLPIDPKNDVIVLKEIERVVWELKELSLRSQLKNISTKIKSNSDDNEHQLEEQFQDVSNNLSKLMAERKLIQDIKR